MKGRFSKRSIGACIAVLAVGLLAGGCDWVQFGADSGLNGDNAADTAITPSNVATLTSLFSASDASTGAVTPQAVVNGILYVSNANGLEAYSAADSTGCSGSPTACAPLWTYPGVSVPASDGVAVVNGKLYVTTASALEAFDATGQTNCAGTPKACAPLWHATLASPSAPTVANGKVFLTAAGAMDVFDANGVTNCSAGVCAPVWTASDVFSDVAISAGIAYVAGGGAVVAIDATGTKDCGGTPKVCTPMWSYPLPTFSFAGGPVESFTVSGYPVISGSTLYVDMFAGLGPQIQGGMEGFDANGVTNCGGTPTVCTPLWTGEAASPLPPLVGSGVAIAGFSSGTPFAAFKDGSVQWLSSGQGKPVAIGGSVVYAEDSVHVYASDVSGSAGCSAGTCSPLWSAAGTDAIVANGMVYVSTTNTSGAGEIVAYGLS